MKRFSDIIKLQIVLAIKPFVTILVLAFPQAFLALFLPLGICSPFWVGAMAYGDIPKALLLLCLVFAAVSSLCLLVLPICIIVNRRCRVYFSYILIACYLLEATSCVLSLIFGNFAFVKLLGLAFNLVVVSFLKQKIFSKKLT